MLMKRRDTMYRGSSSCTVNGELSQCGRKSIIGRECCRLHVKSLLPSLASELRRLSGSRRSSGVTRIELRCGLLKEARRRRGGVFLLSSGALLLASPSGSASVSSAEARRRCSGVWCPSLDDERCILSRRWLPMRLPARLPLALLSSALPGAPAGRPCMLAPGERSASEPRREGSEASRREGGPTPSGARSCGETGSAVGMRPGRLLRRLMSRSGGGPPPLGGVVSRCEAAPEMRQSSRRAAPGGGPDGA